MTMVCYWSRAHKFPVKESFLMASGRQECKNCKVTLWYSVGCWNTGSRLVQVLWLMVLSTPKLHNGHVQNVKKKIVSHYQVTFHRQLYLLENLSDRSTPHMFIVVSNCIIPWDWLVFPFAIFAFDLSQNCFKLWSIMYICHHCDYFFVLPLQHQHAFIITVPPCFSTFCFLKIACQTLRSKGSLCGFPLLFRMQRFRHSLNPLKSFSDV